MPNRPGRGSGNVKRQGGGGVGIAPLLGAAFGAGNIQAVDPGQVDFSDPSFDARTQVRVAPQHPIIDALFNQGQSSSLANQFNLQGIQNSVADQNALNSGITLSNLGQQHAIDLSNLSFQHTKDLIPLQENSQFLTSNNLAPGTNPALLQQPLLQVALSKAGAQGQTFANEQSRLQGANPFQSQVGATDAQKTISGNQVGISSDELGQSKNTALLPYIKDLTQTGAANEIAANRLGSTLGTQKLDYLQSPLGASHGGDAMSYDLEKQQLGNRLLEQQASALKFIPLGNGNAINTATGEVIGLSSPSDRLIESKFGPAQLRTLGNVNQQALPLPKPVGRIGIPGAMSPVTSTNGVDPVRLIELLKQLQAGQL